MKVFDLHSDLFTDIAFRRAAGERRVFDRLHAPVLRRAGVSSVICVFWVEPAFKDRPLKRFRELTEAVMADLAESEYAVIQPFHSVHTRSANSMEDKIQIYLGLEGVTFAEEELAQSGGTAAGLLDEVTDQQIQHTILVWNEHNAFATGTGAWNPRQSAGLTELGKQWITASSSKGVMVDVSHLDKMSFWDVMETVDGPVIASHSNARALCDHERNLTDDQIRAIAGTGGLIGLNAYGEFVDADEPTVDRFIDHAVHLKEVAGIDHVAFGFDFIKFLEVHPLGDDLNIYTDGLSSVKQVPALLKRMAERGFTEEEIEAISFRNAERFLHRMEERRRNL
ncbi:dipeptidase [Sporosarcina trichiuri]|uniref:dipeptidase n=1 Tax=Sporosarcina trichiuri TaxID=3056445 RepID=UPI0025B594ED|nr:membrane dipeptidase [Sporosarcina sp. 0.2-SM1T-5]WJY26246.1 membrane dipeptidase [Sporosarcina sp. 0.2-SM1T-5]